MISLHTIVHIAQTCILECKKKNKDCTSWKSLAKCKFYSTTLCIIGYANLQHMYTEIMSLILRNYLSYLYKKQPVLLIHVPFALCLHAIHAGAPIEKPFICSLLTKSFKLSTKQT